MISKKRIKQYLTHGAIYVNNNKTTQYNYKDIAKLYKEQVQLGYELEPWNLKNYKLNKVNNLFFSILIALR